MCEISEGSELCISYIDIALPRPSRQAQLFRRWHFACGCSRCLSPDCARWDNIVHGLYCTQANCCGLLTWKSKNDESTDLNAPNVLSRALSEPTTSSVLYLPSSFLPSVAGYTGERRGYDFKIGAFGPGYYRCHESEADAAVPDIPSPDGGASEPGTCTRCGRRGLDHHFQQGLVDTAERHKFYYTHKQPFMDRRVAAAATVDQMKQVLAMELSSLHPYHGAVAESLRVLGSMLMVLGDMDLAVRVLKLLYVRSEAVYGFVSATTASVAWLITTAYQQWISKLATPHGVDAAVLEQARVHATASTYWAERTLSIRSVLYGRNHEVTYTANVAMEIAHGQLDRIDLQLDECRRTDVQQARDSALAVIHGTGEVETTPAQPKGAAPAANRNLRLRCPNCASECDLPSGTRLLECPHCGHFLTEVHVATVAGAENDAPSSAFAWLLEDLEAALHGGSPPEERVQLKLAPQHQRRWHTAEIPSQRVAVRGTNLLDPALQKVVDDLAKRHEHRWKPCVVCSTPQAKKQCSGCKLARYCSLQCAKEHYLNGHREECCLLAGLKKARCQTTGPACLGGRTPA